MKIIVEHSETRRVIEGNFNLISDPGTLRMIAKQILREVGEGDSPDPWSYGMVHITEPYFAPKSLNGTTPIGWDQ